jgi:hypothetical protein
MLEAVSNTSPLEIDTLGGYLFSVLVNKVNVPMLDKQQA